MVISRETDYSIRILRRLADDKSHGVSEICASERIPVQIANGIITKLLDAELLAKSKEKEGDLQLRADLKESTLVDVMGAVDNNCCVNLCLVPENICPWRDTHMDTKNVHKTLAAVQEEIDNRLKNMSVFDIIQD